MADKRPPRSGGKPSGRPAGKSFGGKSSGPSGKRPSSGGFGDRKSFGDRAPRSDRSFDDRPKRDFGDRPARPSRSFDDRPKRDFGDRPARPSRSFDDRPKRDFDDRPSRPSRSFDDRPPRGPKKDFGDRPPRREFEDRKPRNDRDLPLEDRPRRNFQREGFGASRVRDDMDTTRKPRGEFGDRPKRDFGDKPRAPRRDREEGGFERREYRSDRGPPRGPKRDFDDRKPRRDYDDKPQRREGFEKRPSARNDFNDEGDAAPKGMKGHEMLIYGVHAAQAALNNPNRKVTTVWISDVGAAHLEGAFNKKRHPEPEVITKREIESKLPAGAVHQGIALAVEPLDDVYLSDILSAANAPNADRQVIVILDEVTDPHNVGAVLRSMSMFGAKAMVVHKRNAPSVTGVMAKIATGAIEHVPMVPVTNLAQAMEELKMAGFYCLGLDEHATISLGEVPTDRHIALVLGNEGEGLRAKTRSTCDAIVAIESFGQIKSLNVSNAAAIALYSITKK